MPTQQRRRRHQEHTCKATPGQHRQQHPISRGIWRSSELSTQHRELMTQNRDLDVSGIRRRTQPDQAQKPADDQETERPRYHSADLVTTNVPVTALTVKLRPSPTPQPKQILNRLLVVRTS
jgi:hypothetical protein